MSAQRHAGVLLPTAHPLAVTDAIGLIITCAAVFVSVVIGGEHRGVDGRDVIDAGFQGGTGFNKGDLCRPAQILSKTCWRPLCRVALRDTGLQERILFP